MAREAAVADSIGVPVVASPSAQPIGPTAANASFVKPSEPPTYSNADASLGDAGAGHSPTILPQPPSLRPPASSPSPRVQPLALGSGNAQSIGSLGNSEAQADLLTGPVIAVSAGSAQEFPRSRSAVVIESPQGTRASPSPTPPPVARFAAAADGLALDFALDEALGASAPEPVVLLDVGGALETAGDPPPSESAVPAGSSAPASAVDSALPVAPLLASAQASPRSIRDAAARMIALSRASLKDLGERGSSDFLATAVAAAAAQVSGDPSSVRQRATAGALAGSISGARRASEHGEHALVATAARAGTLAGASAAILSVNSPTEADDVRLAAHRGAAAAIKAVDSLLALAEQDGQQPNATEAKPAESRGGSQRLLQQGIAADACDGDADIIDHLSKRLAAHSSNSATGSASPGKAGSGEIDLRMPGDLRDAILRARASAATASKTLDRVIARLGSDSGES